jgi:hypothetical protein
MGEAGGVGGAGDVAADGCGAVRYHVSIRLGMRVLTGPLLSVAVRVDEGHGGGRGHGGHASAEDTTS